MAHAGIKAEGNLARFIPEDHCGVDRKLTESRCRKVGECRRGNAAPLQGQCSATFSSRTTWSDALVFMRCHPPCRVMARWKGSWVGLTIMLD